MDHERISALLNIAEKCNGHSGKMSHIQQAAIHELLEVNKEIGDEAKRHATTVNVKQQEIDKEAGVATIYPPGQPPQTVPLTPIQEGEAQVEEDPPPEDPEAPAARSIPRPIPRRAFVPTADGDI